MGKIRFRLAIICALALRGANFALITGSNHADAFILACTGKLPRLGSTSIFAHFMDNTTGKAIEYRVYTVTDARLAEDGTREQREIRVVCRTPWRYA